MNRRNFFTRVAAFFATVPVLGRFAPIAAFERDRAPINLLTMKPVTVTSAVPFDEKYIADFLHNVVLPLQDDLAASGFTITPKGVALHAKYYGPYATDDIYAPMGIKHWLVDERPATSE